MPELEWNDELSMGNDTIDSQHKELIRIVNVLIKAITLGRDRRVVDNVLTKLREYTVFHFNDEEALMDKMVYPQRAEHTMEHARLKREVKEYQRQIYKKETLTADAILEFMKGWLIGHILDQDRELARFIHEEQKEETEK